MDHPADPDPGRRAPAGRALAFAVLAGSLAAAGCATPRIACPVIQRAAATPPSWTAPACPPPRDYPFENLVLEGGGVKGVAYGGALEVLEQQGILGEVERVAGTSAGSIQAALVALGYTPAEIRGILLTLDFKAFRDGGSTGLFRLFRRFGWYRGDNYLDFMRCLVAAKMDGKADATFRDLHDAGKRDLRIFATDLNTGDTTELSFRRTPDLPVAEAARRSGSLPLFFAAMEDARGDVIVDGGVILNYPIDAFDEEGANRRSLGLHLDTTGIEKERKIPDLVAYSGALFETLLGQQVAQLETNVPDLERTVILDDLGISTTDFGITRAQVLALMAKAAECTCSYLADWHGWESGGRRPSEVVDLEPGEGLEVFGFRRCGSAFTPDGQPRPAP